MLKIKLARFGKKNQPHYRIVVNEARSKRDGQYVANLGHYAPTQTPKILVVDTEAFHAWVKKGAQPTETVALLVKRFESGNPFPAKKARPSRKAVAKMQAEKEAAAQAAETPAEPETPVTEEAADTAIPVEDTTAETAATEKAVTE